MISSDKTLSPDTALLWALNAKNSLENHFGFSPFQLHVGRNPVLPSCTRDGPPSFESSSQSKNFVSHMNAMMSAREEFIRAESSFSLKKALKSKVHARGHDIQEGDKIYYKKKDGKGKNVLWQGPAKVTSVNGKKLFVDQGARLGTVNRDDAVRVGEEFWRADDPPMNSGRRRRRNRKNKKSSLKCNVPAPTISKTSGSSPQVDQDSARCVSSSSSEPEEEVEVEDDEFEEEESEEEELDATLLDTDGVDTEGNAESMRMHWMKLNWSMQGNIRCFR